jgi:hypothetical protein
MNTPGMESTEHVGVSRNYNLLENKILIKLKQGIHINNINKSNILPGKHSLTIMKSDFLSFFGEVIAL